jgi:Protein of unknown function (DUF3137)
MSQYPTFEAFYEKELAFTLFDLEAERKKLARTSITGWLLVAAAVIVFIIGSPGSATWPGFLALALLVAGLIAFIIYASNKSQFVAVFKEKIVRKVISYINPTFQYSPKLCINRDDYYSSGLYLTKWDYYNGDDYVEGQLDKTYFCFSELHTQYRKQSGKTSYNVTIFKGLFFIGDFNKHFRGRTYVWSRSNPQLNFITKYFSSFAANLEKVNLESSVFDRSFIVYSNDQVESRYLLTPAFMERMIKLRQMMGDGISFSFINSNVFVAIPIDGKLFEPNIFSPNDYRQAGDYYNTVHIVIDIINELKLNDRLWTKE